jgi:hypothetical protein
LYEASYPQQGGRIEYILIVGITGGSVVTEREREGEIEREGEGEIYTGVEIRV